MPTPRTVDPRTALAEAVAHMERDRDGYRKTDLALAEEFAEDGLALASAARRLLDATPAAPFRPVASESGHVTWTPWTDGFAVGFRVTDQRTGATRYLYLNPSTSGDVDPGGDLGTTFLYEDETGDPADGRTLCYVDVLAPAEAEEQTR